MKICGKCGETKPLTEFHTNGKRPMYQCRACRKQYDAARWAQAPRLRSTIAMLSRFFDKERHTRYARKSSKKGGTARSAMHHARKMKAIPMWLTVGKVMEVYAEAAKRRAAGELCHVDHIVPLKSNLVCGLHNEFNLRIIPSSENQRKSNRHWPDMP